jgi:hypothetical protein
LLIDASLIVFSLAVVNAHLLSESTWKQWSLVGIYTVATIGFNVAHAPAGLQAQIVAAIAPVSLFFSFELLMGQLKNTVKRKAVTRSITELTEYAASVQKKLNVLNAEAEQKQQTTQTELDRLDQQLNRAKEELSQARSQLREAKQQATSQKPAEVSTETQAEAFKILAQWEAEGVNLNRKGAALSRELSTTLGRKVSRKTGSTLLNEYRKMGTTIPENGNGTEKQGTWEHLVDSLPMDETGKDALKRSAVSFTNETKGSSQ